MNKKKLLGYALGPIGSGLLGFISLPIITWFYPIEDVGRISMLLIFTNFTIILFCLGLDQAYIREYHEVENKANLLRTVLLPPFLLSAGFFIVLLIFNSKLISIWLYEVPSTYLSIITVLCFIAGLISRFLSLILRMQERSYAFSMSQLLPKIIFILIVVNSVWLEFSRDTYNLITANFISAILACCIFIWNTRREWRTSLKEQIDIDKLKSVINFGMPLVFGGLAAWGLNAMDRLFLRYYSTYSELGVYSVTMSIAAIVTIFSGIFNTIWSPMVYKWIATSNYDEKKIDKILDCLLAAIYFFIVLSGLFSWVVPYFLPLHYSQIQYLIPICLLGPMYYTLSEVTGIGIAISRKTKFAMICSVIAMIVSCVCNYLMVPVWGAKGAAISTALAFFVFLICRTYFSSYLWVKKSYLKMYFNCALICFVSILHLFFQNSRVYIYCLWLFMFFVGIYYYKYCLKKMFSVFLSLFKRVS